MGFDAPFRVLSGEMENKTRGGLRQQVRKSRPPAYPNKGYILVRTNLPLKRALCQISLRTDGPKFSTMYDPGRGQFAPVWTKDRSVMRTNCSWP